IFRKITKSHIRVFLSLKPCRQTLATPFQRQPLWLLPKVGAC
ncbi:hypothetical protein PanWU01x14_074220, partial [Parasponia andersonii]